MPSKILNENEWCIVDIDGRGTDDLYRWLNEHTSGEWVVTRGVVGFEYDHEAMFFKLAYIR